MICVRPVLSHLIGLRDGSWQRIDRAALFRFLERLKVCGVSQKSCMPNHIERALAWQGPFLWPVTFHCPVSSPVFTVALRSCLPQPLTNRGWPSIPNAPPRGSSAGGSRSVVAPATAACSISLFFSIAKASAALRKPTNGCGSAMRLAQRRGCVPQTPRTCSGCWLP